MRVFKVDVWSILILACQAIGWSGKNMDWQLYKAHNWNVLEMLQ